MVNLRPNSGAFQRRSCNATSFAAILLASAAVCSAQTLLYQETFNDDGEAASPKRYSTLGRGVYEVSQSAELNDPNQLGPVYWAHNFEVSFVGVPAPTGARRMLFVWDAAIDAASASPEILQLWDSSVKWLLNNKASAKIVVSPNAAAIGILADRLTASGYTVVDDDPNVAEDQVATQGDLLIHGVGTTSPSRGAKATIPVIGMSSTDLDDLTLSSIGTATAFEAGPATIVTPSHPAAGGKTGSFPIATGSYTWQLLGDQLPNGAIVLANMTQTIPPAITALTNVDALISGAKPSDKATNPVPSLDFSDSSPGNWTDDNPIPGSVTGNWGLLVTGQLNVTTPGTYSFALGSDDGGRLQIDLDKNGFGTNDTIIESLGPQAHTVVYGNANFTAPGTYDFRVVSYNAGGGGDVEASVATAVGGGKTNLVDSPADWELLGTAGAVSPVKVQGTLQAISYVATGPNEEVQLPMAVLLNGPNDTPPGAVFGGGPFTGFEGRGFFAMSGGNKWAYPDDPNNPGTPLGYRSLTLQPVNVAGKTNLTLTVALAATFLDFETSDFLDILAYPNGLSSTPVLLAHYSAPNDATKYFVDTTHNNTHRLNLNFQDVSYSLPAGATDLVIEFHAATTWWNEIVGFDNVRIYSGASSAPPTVSIASNGTDLQITFTGALESAPTITGPWASVPGNPTSPFAVKVAQQAGATFYRAKE